MRRVSFLFSLLLFTLFLSAASAASWELPEARVRSGETSLLALSAGSAPTVYLTDLNGRALAALPVNFADGRGTVELPADLEPGSYLVFAAESGQSADRMALEVLQPAPVILFADAPADYTEFWHVTATVNQSGTLILSDESLTELGRMRAEPDTDNALYPDSVPGAGTWTLILRLMADDGSLSDAYLLDLTVPEPEPPHRARDVNITTAAALSGLDAGTGMNFWNLPMDISREEEIWEVLTQPITVLSGNERHQYKVRREPDSACTDYTGEVTCESQGVTVLERGETWSRIAAYSSSVEGSRVRAYAKFFTGYVETALLKEKPVSQEYGIVIDKLQQRLYVFSQGHLLSTLLCSTGYARSDTPFNETPAGEFLAISHTGGFWAGSLYCDMGIRINDGILLHEVPCTIEETEAGEKIRHYEKCEYYLGEKASHGCIRIQRATTPEGVNMKWLWENLPRSGDRAKVIIWDDTGRVLEPASDDYVLYYNPNNGRQYHSSAYCSMVNSRFLPLAPFTYGELESSAYKSLSRCPGCSPELRISEVETANSKNNGKAYSR